MNRRTSATAGFTLIELVVAIVLAAIVASFVVLFLDAPVQAYFSQTKRSDLADSANRISNAIASDVRTALPNSLRIGASGSSRALELLATEGVARYYASGENPQPGGTEKELVTGSSTSAFSTLESFNSQALPYTVPYVAVGNLGPGNPFDAYTGGSGVMTPALDPITVNANPGAPPPPGENLVSLTVPVIFQNASAPHNAYLVSGPVSYVCNPNPVNPAAGTLVRYSGYAVTALQAVPPAGPGALIAQDVSACTISFGVASAQYGQLAILRVTLSRGGESLQVFLQARTEYVQ